MSFKFLSSIIRDRVANFDTNDNQTGCIRNDSTMYDYWQNLYETDVVSIWMPFHNTLSIVLLVVGISLNLLFIVSSIRGIRKKKVL